MIQDAEITLFWTKCFGHFVVGNRWAAENYYYLLAFSLLYSFMQFYETSFDKLKLILRDLYHGETNSYIIQWIWFKHVFLIVKILQLCIYGLG